MYFWLGRVEAKHI